MLTLLLGKAGGGKTSYIFSKLAENVKKEKKSILIVPEQYSHDAERALAEACDDSASLFAEVISFSRLCGRVFSETGGLAEKTLDKGGKILAMSLALGKVASGLRVYNVGERGAEFLTSLVKAYEEFKSAKTDASALAEAGTRSGGALGEKLSDLALIFAMYEAVKARSGCDAQDRLARLAESIAESSVTEAEVYIDGFTDFTAQEESVISELLRAGGEVTVCLNTPTEYEEDAVFALSAKTARRLISMAQEHRVSSEILHLTKKRSERPGDLEYLRESLFDYTAAPFGGVSERVEVLAAENPAEECAAAAAKTLRLVRAGARFRDVAVVSPAWERYRAYAGEIFRKYGVPITVAEKSDILEKPVLLFVASALDIITNNWDYFSVFKYLKTGLAGVSAEECDLLENYVLKWNIRGSAMWEKAESWNMPPSGYAESMSDEERETLNIICAAAARATKPLADFKAALDKKEALAKVRAMYRFFEDAGLETALLDKADRLAESGNVRLAEEYGQLWELLLKAMGQFADILADTPLETEEFARLIKLVLSQYDVGTIPTSVDSVGMGPMARMRGRGVKHLIVLGASDDAMPAVSAATGIFSDGERDELKTLGIELADTGERRIDREMTVIYSSFSQASESLTVSYSAGSGTGRRSFVVTRMMDLLSLREKTVGEEIYTEAPAACFEYAVSGVGEGACAAREYFKTLPEWREKLDTVTLAAAMPRGRLARMTAEKLYGKNINLSASKVDKYSACRFSYFLRYGLKATPRKGAELDAPETGTMMHFVLENVVRDTEKSGGFASVGENELRRMTLKYVREYAQVKLGGLEEKSGRFRYLYSRLAEDAVRIVLCMADELKNSDFKPLDFELDFSYGGDMPPAEIAGRDGTVCINGKVDRVDGWISEDKLYIRVVDYKTGRKSFTLSDICYGMGLQMLIYLFLLEKNGMEHYGREVVPAGVLYVPARDAIVTSGDDLTDEELAKKRADAVKRSGILLSDPAVLDAMEHGGKNTCLPIKFAKDGTPTGESLVTLEQMGKLSRHIDTLIAKMGEEIRAGSITADPYFRSSKENACVYCDYFDVCHFGDGKDDRRRYLSKLKTPEAWEKIGGADDE